MARLLRNALVAGSCLAVARHVDDCVGDTCVAPVDNVQMLQVARLSKLSNASRSFVKRTKPFLGGRTASLNESEQGAIQIDEDGVINTYYLPGATTEDGGKRVKFVPPYRFYLMRQPTTDYSKAEHFYMPEFMGKTFTVDMNFGSDGPSCGCNLNFYLVGMPWSTPGDESDYYCDAQCFPDKGCCAEFDMNEGNMAVQQITNHACTGNYPGHDDWACHKWGDPEVKTHDKEFGIGSQFTIDSTKPFSFSQRFDVQNDDFVFTTTMSQEDRSVEKVMGPGSSELNAMRDVIEGGMAFVTGYWFAPDMNWMDGEACGTGPEHCSMNPAYISNWRLTSNNGTIPAPAPTPPAPEPAPAPGPVPAPPTSGNCCWGPECSNCAGSEDWCAQSMENCWKCGNGGWCPTR